MVVTEAEKHFIELFDGLDQNVVEALFEASSDQLRKNMIFPPSQRGHSGEITTELLVAVPIFDSMVSIKLRNLVSNALTPNGFRQALLTSATPAVISAVAGGPVAWVAFMLAVTSLAARTVQFAEACILHKSWKIAGFDKIVTVDALLNVAQEIQDEYGIVKHSAADIETYLNTLVRQGCMEDHPNGYKLVERIYLKKQF